MTTVHSASLVKVGFDAMDEPSPLNSLNSIFLHFIAQDIR